MLIRILFSTLTIGAATLISSAPAHAFPITCPGGVVVEIGHLCPLPPWLGGPSPDEPAEIAAPSPADPAAVNQCSLDGGVWNTDGNRCDILPQSAPAKNNRPADDVLNACSLNKGVWNTAQGYCEYPNDDALANQCSLDKGVWNRAARRCDIL